QAGRDDHHLRGARRVQVRRPVARRGDVPDHGALIAMAPVLPDHDRCLVMGIVNVTEDSFSDGGRWNDPAIAVAHAKRLMADGAAAGSPVSVDTMRAAVAEAAIEAGAALINDVSGGLADPRMLDVCAAAEVPVCLMHWRTERFGSASGRAEPSAAGIVAEVHD